MKQKIKFMALVLLGIMLSINQMWGAAAPVNTVLWGENFAHFGTNTPSSAGTGTGTTIYNKASISYAQSSTNTKGYNENLAKGAAAPELLLAKKTSSSAANQTWTISGIPTGDATVMTLTFVSNNTAAMSVTSNTTGISIGTLNRSGSTAPYSYSVEITAKSVTTFNLVISNTSTSNKRLDDFVLKVKTAGTGGSVDPTITFNNGNYTVGGAALNLSTLFTSNSSGAVTYTITNAGGTGASIAGTSFTATTAGNATVQAAQAAATGYNAKSVTATITVTAAAPEVPTITTISDLFTTATSTGTTAKDIKLTLNNWVVTAVTSANNILVTDGTNGFIINGASTGFAVGDKLSGTAVECKVKQDGNKNTIVTGLSTSNVTATAGGSVEPIETAISALNSGLYTGSIRTVTGIFHVDYATSHNYLVDGDDYIWLGNTILDPYSLVEDGAQYTVTGVYWMNGTVTNASQRVMPRSAADIRDDRWTITWSVNGNTGVVTASKFNPGAAISFPDAAAVGEVDCNGKVFVGWSDKSSVNSSTGDLVTSATATGNKTYYAVFADAATGGTATYKNVTSLTAGKNYIFGAVKAAASATLANNTAFGAVAFTNAYSATSPNWGAKVDLTPDANGVIAADNSSITTACIWTLVSITSGNYTFKNGSNYIYLGDKAGSTTNGAQSGVSTASGNMYLENVNSTCKNAFLLHPASDNTNVMLYNTSNGYRMYAPRSYNATMSPYVRFYEYNPGITYSNFTTECVEPTYYYIAGLGGDWTEANWTEMTVVDGVASVKVNLPVSTAKEFKIVEKTGDAKTWYGNAGAIITDISGWDYTNGGDNTGLYTGPAGEYTFTFNTTTHKVAVTYPSVTHPAAGYAYFQKQDSWSGFKVYNFTNDGNRLTDWDGSPAVTNTTTICGTVYYYTALATKFEKVIFRDNGSNEWKEIAVSGFSGKYCGDDYDANPQVWKEFSTYTITFAGGTGATGSMDAISNIACGSSKVIPANRFSKTGHNFTGWKDQDDNSYAGGATIANVTKDLTLTAQWAVNNYTLTWDLDGGTITTEGTAAGSVPYDAPLTAPVVEKTGYTFAGWSPTVPATMGAANVTYTATWTIQNYAITWMVSGNNWNTGHGTPSTSADYNTAITNTPNAPTKSDCDEEKVFVGWTTSQIDTETDTKPSPLYREAGDFDVVTGPMTYYAVFATVSAGGSGTITLTNSELTSAFGGSYETKTFTKTIDEVDYEIEINGCKQDSKLQLRDNSILSYVWIKNLPGDITNISTTACTNASGANYTGELHLKSSKTRPVKPDIDKDDLAKVSYEGITSFSWDITASGVKAAYLFTTAGLRVTDLSIKYGSMEGYITECVQKDPISDPTNLQATVTSSTTATISWNAVEHAATYTVLVDGVAIASSPTTSTSVDLTGFTAGSEHTWSVQANGEAGYKNSNVVPGPNFTTLRVFTVSFNKNAQAGGSVNGNCPVSGCSTTVEENSLYTIPDNTGNGGSRLTLAGYDFNGWNNSPECTETPYYTIGNQLTITGDVIFYANWTPKTDKYIDEMHGTTGYTGEGKAMSGNYTVPILEDEDSGSTDCKTTHSKFIGWIATSYKAADGTITDTNVGKVFAGGTKKSATGATYYAVWAVVND